MTTTPNPAAKNQALTKKQELSQKLQIIMETLEGLTFEEIDIMLANVQASARQDGIFNLQTTAKIEFQNLRPPK